MHQYFPPRDEVSFHEAGHAVVAIAEGATVTSMRVGQITSRLGGQVCITFDRGSLSVRSQMLIAQAGTAAQMVRILLRDWDGVAPAPQNWMPSELLTVNAQQDAELFNSIIGKSASETEGGSAMVGALGAAIRYVTMPEHWGKIDALASAFRLNDQIEPDEVFGIVFDAQRSREPRLTAAKLVAVNYVAQLL